MEAEHVFKSMGEGSLEEVVEEAVREGRKEEGDGGDWGDSEGWDTKDTVGIEGEDGDEGEGIGEDSTEVIAMRVLLTNNQ